MITSLPTKRISAISQRQTFMRVLRTRWRRKPAGIEITSLSHYVSAQQQNGNKKNSHTQNVASQLDKINVDLQHMKLTELNCSSQVGVP